MPDTASVHCFCLEIARLRRRFNVFSFRATEAISQLFVFELEITGDGFELDLTTLMYTPAFLNIEGSPHGFHGQIHGAARLHHRPGPACYRLKIGPRLACLGQRYNQRVFQHMSATQIIERVLDEHGMSGGYRFDLRADCQERETCVQYGESDLELVQRLCAEEGIHYHFHHSRRRHELVFGDGLRGFRQAPIATWHPTNQRPGVTAFDVTSDGVDLPGSRAFQRAHGESTLPFIDCGYLLPLAGHPEAQWNHMWLVTRVEHRYGTHATHLAVDQPRYLNHFQAIPWEKGFTPPDTPPRPLGTALQRAWILGPMGETAERDAAGRVKAQFEWGQQGVGARYSECWLPVAPGVDAQCKGGAEAVVDFQNNDMDRPVITAILHTQEQLPEFSTVGEHDTRPANSIRMQLDWQVLLGDENTVQLGDTTLQLDPESELLLQVGASQVRLERGEMTLISPRITFASEPDSGADSAPEPKRAIGIADDSSDPDNIL